MSSLKEGQMWPAGQRSKTGLLGYITLGSLSSHLDIFYRGEHIRPLGKKINSCALG